MKTFLIYGGAYLLVVLAIIAGIMWGAGTGHTEPV